MNWKQFIVLYEESEALVRLQEVLKMSSQNRGLKITLRQLTPGPGNTSSLKDSLRCHKIGKQSIVMKRLYALRLSVLMLNG